jgi:phage shock protein PspC (stress-responsive transcriptional regulator)
MHFLDRPSLFNRPDTFLGVSQGLGEDLGVHPNIVRLIFAGVLFWNPVAAACAYTGAGVLVLTARLIFPVPSQAAAEESVAAPAVEAVAAQEDEQLPLAA